MSDLFISLCCIVCFLMGIYAGFYAGKFYQFRQDFKNVYRRQM